MKPRSNHGISAQRRLAVLLTMAVGATLAPGEQADASEVRVERVPQSCPFPCDPGYFERVIYRADGGETNRVTFSGDATGSEFRIVDPGAVVRAGMGCAAVSRHEVTCRATVVPDIYVLAGDQGDTVISAISYPDDLAVVLPAVKFDGGGGDDQLTGADGPDLLFAGPGSDVLSGGAGNDALLDAALRDPAEPTEDNAAVRPERDTFDGGAGHDVVGYGRPRRGVHVDLAETLPRAGRPGERDTAIGFESAAGGYGDDRLLGNDLGNDLSGGLGGNDVLHGRAGPDRLTGSRDDTTLRGGPGADTIRIDSHSRTSGGRQRVFCGPQEDSVHYLLPNDFAAGDCERIDTIDGAVPVDFRSLLPLVRGRPLTVFSAELLCFSDRRRDCGATLELRIARRPAAGTKRLVGVLLGRRRAQLRPSSPPQRFALKLSRRGGRLLRRHRTLVVRATIRLPGGRPSGYLTRLHAPRR